MKTSYVAVAGIPSVKRANNVASLIRATGFNKSQEEHVPMVSVSVSSESLYAGFSRNDHGLPSLRQLPAIMEAVRPYTFTALQYHTENTYFLAYDVERILSLGEMRNGLVDGIQFNNVWPDAEKMKTIRDSHPDLSLILPLSFKSVNGKGPDQIAERVFKDYGFVDYVIIEVPAGANSELDIGYAAKLYKALKGNGAWTIGFSGDFNGHSVEHITHLKEAVGGTDFCTTEEECHDGHNLDLAKVRSFLRGNREVLLH